jgi:hypothetical protein
MSAHHGWGGALTALGSLTTLGGIAGFNAAPPPGSTQGQENDAAVLVTAVGAGTTGLGIYLLTRPDKEGRSRTRSTASYTRSRRRRSGRR